MLPILRLISVGGVSLAIIVVLLALTPPEESRVRLARVKAPASGALIDRDRHPEWRHFLIQAALRRADALEKLRDIPDTRIPVTPVIVETLPPLDLPPVEKPPRETIADLPQAPYVGDLDDITGAIETGTDDGSIPVGIGAASSAELDVTPTEEAPPVTTIPALERRHESRQPRSRAPRHAKAVAQPQAPVRLNLLEAQLALFTIKPDAAGDSKSTRQASN